VTNWPPLVVTAIGMWGLRQSGQLAYLLITGTVCLTVVLIVQRCGTGTVVLTVVMYDSRLIWHEPVPTYAISALHWWLQ